MKLFHVIGGLYPGGAELMVARLARYQRQHQRIEPVVVTLVDGGSVRQELQTAGIKVYSLGLKGMSGAASATWRLSRLIAREKPAIVQTWMYHSDLMGALAALLARNRNVIWGIRNTDVFPGAGVSGAVGPIVRMCALLSRHLPSAIVCVAEAARKNHARLGYAEDLMVVVPNGYTPTPAGELQDKGAARHALGLPEDALIIGSVGRFNAYKDPATFVRAMAIVAHELPRAVFVMVGRDLDQNNNELKSWIGATGHSGRFFLLGYRSDIRQCFAAMDCFCLHSKSEGFPNVLGEAMMAGIPSVATDVGDARLMGAGLIEIVPPQDPKAMARAVTTLCQMSATERRRRGAAGKRHMENNYTLERVAERYRRLYEAVIAGETPTGL